MSLNEKLILENSHELWNGKHNNSFIDLLTSQNTFDLKKYSEIIETITKLDNKEKTKYKDYVFNILKDIIRYLTYHLDPKDSDKLTDCSFDIIKVIDETINIFYSLMC